MKRNEKKPLGCGICPYKTNSACHLERHLRIHTGQKPYACDMCSYRATDGGLLKRHMRIHSGEKPFICHICGHKTAQSCSLKDHMAVHTGKKRYSCDLCPFQCSRIGRLRDHQRIHKIKTESARENVPKNEMPVTSSNEPNEPKNDANHVLHKCSHCNLEFSETQYLDRHVTSVHASVLIHPAPLVLKPAVNENQESPFFCSLCAVPQESSKALNNHIASHILYKCLKCKSIFETTDELTAHGFTHTSELVFDCNFCDFKCRTRNELRGHGRIHSTQQFKCKTCDFESKSAVEFSQHLMTHTMKEIVMCNICSQKFRKTEELRDHMVSHYSRVRARTVRKISELKPNSLKQEVIGDSYSCFYCSFKCPDEGEVENHILHTHVSRNLSTKHYASNTKLTRIGYHEEEGTNNTANANQFLQPDGLHGSTLENTSNSCLMASDHQQMDFSLAGLGKTVLSQQIYQSAFFIGNQYSRGYRVCQQRGLFEIPSLQSLSCVGHYSGRQSLPYSLHQFCDVQLNSEYSDEFRPPNCNPPISILQANQMNEPFPKGGYSSRITHNSNSQRNLPNGKDGKVALEQGASIGMGVTNSNGMSLNHIEHDAASDIHQQRGTAMETDCEHFAAEIEFSRDNQNKAHSPISGRTGSKKIVTDGKTRKTDNELGDYRSDFETNSPENYQSKPISKHRKLSENLLTSESAIGFIHSYQATKVPCTVSTVTDKSKNDSLTKDEHLDKTCESGYNMSTDRAKSVRVKRNKNELNRQTSNANILAERRVTRNSRLREKDCLHDNEMKTEGSSTVSGEKESSGDVLLSKLRKFFDESLPNFNSVYSGENSSPQADDGTEPSSPIFTIDLSSDNESSDIN